ncbi:MAG: DUF4124 domain-containing protein [Deltaproteobacteria bacterium]|nr:DUF4124 domain-containing protein [Deltaproteobacteria bacterium]MBW2394381.1 DUF4124 domain-containing protein [Deltaproteobacteria bacterium]
MNVFRMSGMLVLFAGLALASPGNTEIYRCTDPDGSVRFTGDASQCPGANKHEPKGEVQTIPPSGPRQPRPAPAARAKAGMTEDANAARWRGKKLQAQQQLVEIEARLPGMHKATGWCNRGNTLYRTDDLGRRRTIKCDVVLKEYEQLQQARDQLAGYLAEGLEEECRRSGCLPGWIR